jgi:hypothetical protein
MTSLNAAKTCKLNLESGLVTLRMFKIITLSVFADYAASKTIIQIGFWTAVNEANQFCNDISCPISVGNVNISKVSII